jgi:hypothetical protein
MRNFSSVSGNLKDNPFLSALDVGILFGTLKNTGFLRGTFARVPTTSHSAAPSRRTGSNLALGVIDSGVLACPHSNDAH